MQKSIILGVIVAQYVALPLTSMLIIKGAIRLGMVHSDLLYQFLLLQYALPPAMKYEHKEPLLNCLELERVNVQLSCSGRMPWLQDRLLSGPPSSCGLWSEVIFVTPPHVYFLFFKKFLV